MVTEEDLREQLAELYERNDKIEKQLGRLTHTLKSEVARKNELLQELNQVIDEIERIESELPEAIRQLKWKPSSIQQQSEEMK